MAVALFFGVAALVACSESPLEPPTPPSPGTPDTPTPTPTVEPAERMGKGQLFDLLSAIPGVSRIEAVRNKDFHAVAFDEEYQFYIEQQIDPTNPAVGTFRQKARIGHRGFDRPMVLVTEGYALEDKDSAFIYNYPASLVEHNQADAQGEEISRHFGTNMLVVEHRYFYTSNPDTRDWTYLTARNASADLHRVYEALKPLYKKPWISTGVSKGGITAMLYHMMYPDDVDICVPYATPMCLGLNDDRARDYVAELAGTPETRKRIKETKNWLLSVLKDDDNQKELFDEYRRQWNKSKNDRGMDDNTLASLFFQTAVCFDSDMWNYGNNWAIEIMPTEEKDEYRTFEWVANWVAKMELTKKDKYGIGDTGTHFSVIDPTEYDDPQTRAVFYDYNTLEDKVDKELPYNYMAMRELGQVKCYGVDGLTFSKELQSFFDKLCADKTAGEYLKEFRGFDSKDIPAYTTELHDQCVSYYQQHDDRVIFLYGANDLWTGCGINDVWKDVRSDRSKYPVFGFDSKRQMACYIAPDYGHNVEIKYFPADKQQEIWAKIEKWIEETDKAK